MKCPKCGSEHVQFTTSTKGGGVSFLDSCCGFIFLGPLGLLCGTIGAGEHTEEFWICHDCGHKFSTKEGKQRVESDQQKASSYASYKAELKALSVKEGSYQDIRTHFLEAAEQNKAAKQQYEQLLLELASDKDEQVKRLVKKMNGTTMGNIFTGIFVVGIACLFYVLPLGILLLAIAIPSSIIYESRKKNYHNILTQLHPELKDAEESMELAKEQLSYYEALRDKVEYIEKYESERHES